MIPSRHVVELAATRFLNDVLAKRPVSVRTFPFCFYLASNPGLNLNVYRNHD